MLQSLKGGGEGREDTEKADKVSLYVKSAGRYRITIIRFFLGLPIREILKKLVRFKEVLR